MNRGVPVGSGPHSAPVADQEQPRTLLITSNGAGMGHLTRMLAVALAAGDPRRCTIMSMSVALPVVIDQGIRGEYCPSVDRGWFTGPQWHRYLADRIVALATEVGAEVIAFDGVAPYRGVALAAERLPDVALVWMRRGLWRPGANQAQIETSSWFDLIVEPGDLAQAADRGATAGRTDAVQIPPVSMLDVLEPLPRDQARAELGLVGDGPTLLVTLGSGRLGEVAAPGQVVLEAALEHPGWQIALTRSAIATQEIPVAAHDRVHLLAGVYPLVRYLNAFDAVVSAAGYNAVHEFVSGGLPTLLIPNPATRTDDQLGRAQQLAAEGLALAVTPENPDELAAAVRDLLTEQTRTWLSESVADLDAERRGGGAQRAQAEFVAGLTAFRAARASGKSRPLVSRKPARGRTLGARQRARMAARRVLGRRGANAIRRVLRRTPEQPPLPALPVQFIEGTALDPADPTQVATTAAVSTGDSSRLVLFGAALPAAAIRGGPPVEHLIADGSAQYRRQRRDLAAQHHEQR